MSRPRALGILLVAALPVAAAALSGCVYDRTGRSASGRLIADVGDARARLATAEERLAREGARIDDLDQRSQAARKFLADSGADLQSLLQAVQDVQGALSGFKQELGRTQQTSSDLDARLIEIEDRLVSIEEQIAAQAAPPAKGGKDAPKGGKGAKPEKGEKPEKGRSPTGKLGAADPPDGGLASGAAPASAPGVADGAAPPERDAVTALPDPSLASLSADDLLVRGLSLTREQKYGPAGAAFQAFVDRFPDHPQVGQARFLLAGCLFDVGEYRLAVQRYQEFIDHHPASVDRPKAMLRQGQAFIQMGGRSNLDAAKLFLDDLIEGFPGSAEAGRAREEMARLK